MKVDFHVPTDKLFCAINYWENYAIKEWDMQIYALDPLWIPKSCNFLFNFMVSRSETLFIWGVWMHVTIFANIGVNHAEVTTGK